MTQALKSAFRISDKGQQMLLALITVAWTAVAAIGAILAVFSPLVFDGPGNMRNPVAWLGFVLGALFWAVCMIGPLVGWIRWRKGKRTEAWAAMAAPAAWAALTITVLQFIPG
ncbi:MAG: hypothetical protein PSX79_08855 [bacterium]|nr:hypothetical protein [Alphaproteobacteria bacterium]MDI1364959.1 hypothetical protein [bacterium]